jgi:hypothetical protein
MLASSFDSREFEVQNLAAILNFLVATELLRESNSYILWVNSRRFQFHSLYSL